MDVTSVFMTHAIARRENKQPFFFSRFNFERMKERGNTHYCFHCGGSVGFTPRKKSSRTHFFASRDIAKPTNHVQDGFDAMKTHNETHADGVVGRALRYADAGAWLQSQLHNDFLYIVNVT